jgi:hypothetical protein
MAIHTGVVEAHIHGTGRKHCIETTLDRRKILGRITRPVVTGRRFARMPVEITRRDVHMDDPSNRAHNVVRPPATVRIKIEDEHALSPGGEHREGS